MVTTPIPIPIPVHPDYRVSKHYLGLQLDGSSWRRKPQTSVKGAASGADFYIQSIGDQYLELL